ncbi:hypothetical protein FE257_013039 [Aspergillus nanangensis]|uniref:DUF7730 domain-containing protein n=1 Tax=Aspergillus nanangensis TaxID=2582783 RepID=A0AAD4CFF8_ASPNN|nr:hypothetical protein FE257_013039 [Aspergillus nanangensis]
MVRKRKRRNNPEPKTQKEKKAKLTVPPDQWSREKEQNIHSQEQSDFLRLPQEIREIIYRYIIIQPTTIHISYAGTKPPNFTSFLCQTARGERQYSRPGDHGIGNGISHHQCTPRVWRFSASVKRNPPEVRQHARVMSLLCSCKRTYFETVDMLYHENVFYIENPRTLLELSTSMPQHRLSAFRQLYIESPTYNQLTEKVKRQWARVVGVLKRLDGLEVLCVILRLSFPEGKRQMAESLKLLKDAELPVCSTVGIEEIRGLLADLPF